MTQTPPEITERLHTLFGTSMKDREADQVMIAVNHILDKDGPEFIGLITIWYSLKSIQESFLEEQSNV